MCSHPAMAAVWREGGWGAAHPYWGRWRLLQRQGAAVAGGRATL